MHAPTHTEQPAVSNPAAGAEANPARVYRARGRAAAKRRNRTRRAMRSETATVAFRGSEDAHALNPNPNRGKRHAAPASQREPRTTNRTRTEPRVTLRTWSAKQPSLPAIISKNVPRPHARGIITPGE